jgi:hypothetical protein
MATSKSRMLLAVAICAGMIALSGCSQSFTAREYPSFYDPNLRTIAVVPFHNETNARGAGTLAAENLAAALRVNGTYTVVPPHKLRSLIAQKKLQRLSRTDYQEDAEELRKLGGIQAFIVGRVLRDSTMQGLYPTAYPYWSYDSASDTPSGPARYEFADEDEEGEGEDDFGDDFYGPYYGYWYWNYPYYYPTHTARAYVSLEASMIRVSDGAVLYTTPVPAEGHSDLSGWRQIPPASAGVDAMNRAAAKLVKDLAVVPVTVKVRPSADLNTAVRGQAGGWDFTNTFRPTDENMYVVIQLPTTVSHDTFRLTVTPKGQPDDIVVTEDFTWPVGENTDAVALSPKEIARRAGTGSYTVSFHAFGESVMRHNFRIKQ